MKQAEKLKSRSIKTWWGIWMHVWMVVCDVLCDVVCIVVCDVLCGSVGDCVSGGEGHGKV